MVCLYYFLKGKDSKSTEIIEENDGVVDTAWVLRKSKDPEGCMQEENPDLEESSLVQYEAL